MATTLVLFRTSPAYGGAGQGPRGARLRLRRHQPADRRAAARRIERHLLDGPRAQCQDFRGARGGRRRRPSRARWTRSAPTRRSCSRCSAARCGRSRRRGRSCARLGGAARVVSPPGSAKRSRRRAAISRRPIGRTRSARSGRPGCCMPGLGPESAYSAAMAKVIAFAIEAAGCPIAVGGAKTLLDAFERLIVDQGGAVRTDADVVRILPGPARERAGVELASGETIAAAKGVICSTTPEQLYGRLLQGLAHAVAARRPEGSEGLSVRQGRHADPLRAQSAAALAGRSGPGQGRAPASDARTGRRFARGQRSRARPPAGRADDLRRPADRARSEPRAAGGGDPLAAIAGGAALCERRRGGRDRRARRRPLDGGAYAKPTPTGSSGGSPRTSRIWPRSSSRAAPIRRPTSRP